MGSKVPKYLYEELSNHANDEAAYARKKVSDFYDEQKQEVYDRMSVDLETYMTYHATQEWTTEYIGSGSGNRYGCYRNNVRIPRVHVRNDGQDQFNSEVRVAINEIIQEEADTLWKIETRLRNWKNGLISMSLTDMDDLAMPKFDDIIEALN